MPGGADQNGHPPAVVLFLEKGVESLILGGEHWFCESQAILGPQVPLLEVQNRSIWSQTPPMEGPMMLWDASQKGDQKGSRVSFSQILAQMVCVLKPLIATVFRSSINHTVTRSKLSEYTLDY